MTAAASMCIRLSHTKGFSSSCCWELHSRLLLQVCASAHLTQEDPEAVVVGSFIQDCCKDVYISAISPKRILHLLELHWRLLLQGMCICPSQPKRIQQLALELHWKLLQGMCICRLNQRGSSRCWSFTRDRCKYTCICHLTQRGSSHCWSFTRDCCKYAHLPSHPATLRALLSC